MPWQAWLGCQKSKTAFLEHHRPPSLSSRGGNGVIVGQRALTTSGLPCQGTLEQVVCLMPSSDSAGMEPIDLTLDDDVEIFRQAKRARRNDGDDSDVEVVDEPLLAPVSASQAAEEPQLDQDGDILITKHTGQVRGWWSYHKCPFQVEWHMFGPLFSSSRVSKVMPCPITGLE